MTSQPPVGTPQPSAPRRSRAASRAIAILTAALGCAVVVGTLWSGAAPTVAAGFERDEQRDLAVDGVDGLDVDIAAASFVLRFDDVDEASLDVRGARTAGWTLREDDGTLVVRSPDWSFFTWFGGDNGRATLTLPRELEGSDLSVQFGAGSFSAEGDFGEIGVESGAGEIVLAGSARSLSMQLGAGRGDVDLEGVREADLTLSAGSITARLTGEAPDTVDLEVSAGSIELTVPDDEYDVSSEVAAGDFTHDLRTATGAAHRIHAEVAAGDARVTAD